MVFRLFTMGPIGAGHGRTVSGRSMALAIASAGGTVIAVARTAADLNEVADRGRGWVPALPWDLAVAFSRTSLADRAGDIGGPLSGVYCSPGSSTDCRQRSSPLRDWHKVTSLDLDAPSS